MIQTGLVGALFLQLSCQGVQNQAQERREDTCRSGRLVLERLLRLCPTAQT